MRNGKSRTGAGALLLPPLSLFLLHDVSGNLLADYRAQQRAQPAKLAELTARLKVLSAQPVPYDSCLPGCTASKACDVAKQEYSNFFGPYFPPVPLAAAQ